MAETVGSAMASGHRVHRERVPRLALPKEVEPVGRRLYRDRFGLDYTVIWDGRRADPYLFELRDPPTAPST